MDETAWTVTSGQITFGEARAAGLEKQLLRLPIVGAWPSEVQVMSTNRNGSSRPGVVMVARRAEVPTTLVHGIRVTSLEFSLLQVARRAPLLPALVAANAACYRPRFDADSQRTTPERLRAEHERLMPYRGCRKALMMLDRVRETAESVLETVSEVAIEELGFAPPQHQQRFVTSTGEVFVDFYWEDERIVGESDGDVKYRCASTGAASAENVIEEKRREDEVRGQVNGLARWGWRDAWQRTPLEHKLLQVGVPRIRLPKRLG